MQGHSVSSSHRKLDGVIWISALPGVCATFCLDVIKHGWVNIIDGSVEELEHERVHARMETEGLLYQAVWAQYSKDPQSQPSRIVLHFVIRGQATMATRGTPTQMREITRL